MFEKIKDANGYFKQKHFDTLAGSLSFFFILSFVPLLFLCLYLYVKMGEWFHLETPIPEQIEEYVTFDLNAGVSILFLLTTVYSASKFFLQLRKTGEIIYNIKKPRTNILTIVLSCLAVVLSMVVVSAALIMVAAANTYLTKSWEKILINIGSALLFIAVLYLFIYVVNKFSCLAEATKKDLRKGIIYSLIYVLVVSAIFIVYVSLFANYEKLYGVFATLIISFMYVFLMMKGIIEGIILNEKKLKSR